jgi:SPP1 gp7 family putative phage head morphogenesis protein
MPDVLQPLAMKEARQFWADKVKLSPGQYSKLSAEAKLRAFAVSGIAKGDELSTVFSALQKALDDGTTFEEFKRQTGEIFERRGWSGKSAWRVDNIFRTNIQTAYNVGRYQQMARVAQSRPYWMYDAVNGSRTRLHHRALDGKVFPADHPFWDRWYPPNGFRCRCGVRSLSERQVKARGLKVESSDPTGKLFEPVDPLTGVKYPARLLIPDPGFRHHPGKAMFGGIVDGQLQAGKKLAQLPNLKGAADYRLPGVAQLKRLPATPALLKSVAQLKADGMSNRRVQNYYRDKFRQAFDMPEGGEKVFSVAGEAVIVSERLVVGKGGRVKITKGDRGQYIPLFRQAITEPDEVWLVPMKDDSGKVVLRRRHLKYWRGEDENLAGFGVLDIEGGAWNGISVYDVQVGQQGADGESLLDGPDGYRRGVLLHKRKK